MSNTLELKVVFAAVNKFSGAARKINEEAGALSKELRAAKDAMKALEKQQGLIDSFRSTNKGLGIAKNDLQAARQRVEQMAKAMESVGVPSERMQRNFKHATQEARNLAAQVNRLTEKKQRLRGELGAVGIDTKKLSEHQRVLKSNLEGAAAAVDKQQKALDVLRKTQQKVYALRADVDKARERGSKLVGTGAKAMAAGTAVNAAAAVPVMAYAKAEDAATQLQIAMMQKGGQVSADFKAIDELAGKLGNKLPGTTADYQDMMTMLIRQGMPAKNILGGLGEATAYLAVQLKMAPTQAAEFASKLQDATRATDKEMMGLMDTIQKTFYLGVDQNNMLQGFAKLSPALSILRKEGAAAAKELAPLLVMADQSGMQGEAAGNAYRKIFQMSLDGKKVAKGNAELGGTGIKLDFTDGKGEFGGLDKMYAQLEKLRGVDSQRRLAALKKIFGDDAETLQALTLMIDKGVGGYREVQAKMEAQANLQERVNKQLGTLTNLWDAAKGTFTNALVALGESVAPELHATAEWLGKVAEKTQAWAKENPGLAEALMTVAKWTGGILIVLGGLAVVMGVLAVPMAIMSSGFGILGAAAFGAFGMIRTGIAMVGRALLLNPIGLTLTGIATAAYLIYENWDWLKGKFTAIIDWILGKIEKFKELMREVSGFSLFGDKATVGNRPIPAPPLATATGQTTTLKPVVAPAANRPNPGHSIFNINVNGGQNASPTELAAQIRREMEAAERAKAARARGRLRDQE